MRWWLSTANVALALVVIPVVAVAAVIAATDSNPAHLGPVIIGSVALAAIVALLAGGGEAP